MFSKSRGGSALWTAYVRSGELSKQVPRPRVNKLYLVAICPSTCHRPA